MLAFVLACWSLGQITRVGSEGMRAAYGVALPAGSATPYAARIPSDPTRVICPRLQHARTNASTCVLAIGRRQ